jgi:hypothetical protein
MKGTKRVALTIAGVAVVATGLAGCDQAPSTVRRVVDPVVLTGAQLPALVGATPGDVVAFAHRKPGGTATWDQIPVQIDERKVVPFGTHPSNNTTAGTPGTIYGSGSSTQTVLTYADANTWVGADSNAAFDADDELVFMAEDAGSLVSDDVAPEPAGVVAGSGVAVKVEDPQDTGSVGYVYLFRRAGTGLDPSAGEDYVDYDFQLVSGNYKTTYKRATGPNPETTTITTDTYTIGFTDRWFETTWKVGDGADLLDGHKNVFAFGNCGRSNQTFVDGEGAFVANIDGPVRGIRSYVGANSGPKTQRTHYFYRDHEVTVTDLRVHAIPAIADYIDYGPGAIGSTYRSSTLPGGVTVDGAADSVPATVPTWEAVHGAEGTVVTMSRYTNTFSAEPTMTWFYSDDATPTHNQCWGDSSYLGASGSWIISALPNTDPAAPPFQHLQGKRTTVFLEANTDGAMVNGLGGILADDVDQPLTVTPAPYAP